MDKVMQNEELFPVVDDTGKIIGEATRSECHNGSKILHPVIHLHIFNQDGLLFLQKRSPLKDIQPNKWDSSVGGHIDLGETPEQAVLREAKEELGISIEDFKYITQYIIETDQERELTYCFFSVYNGPFHIDNNEVTEGRFWALDEIQSQINQGVFTYNFEQDFQSFLSFGIKYLQKIK